MHGFIGRYCMSLGLPWIFSKFLAAFGDFYSFLHSKVFNSKASKRVTSPSKPKPLIYRSEESDEDMMEEKSDSEKSALTENISRKGNNSYYYAHGKKIDGPKWDGKEEPRLLETKAVVSEKKKPVVAFDSFSWLDEKKSIKIYVDFENADKIENDAIVLVSEVNNDTYS